MIIAMLSFLFILCSHINHLGVVGGVEFSPKERATVGVFSPTAQIIGTYPCTAASYIINLRVSPISKYFYDSNLTKLSNNQNDQKPVINKRNKS